MHPYGGTPRCPRCDKAVYAAEQVMGPGRRLYHKFCLTCKDCNRRLDSFSLVEHDEEPYCKNCHSKNFGTRDLRQANLPHRADSDVKPLSPTRTGSFPPVAPLSPTRTGFAVGANGNGNGSASPVRASFTGDRRAPFAPPLPARNTPVSLLRPTRALSPTRGTFAPLNGNFDPVPEDGELDMKATKAAADQILREEEERERAESEDEVAHTLSFPPNTPTHTGRSANGLPRSGHVSPTKASRSPDKPVAAPPFDEEEEEDVKNVVPTVTMTLGRKAGTPLTQTPTGTRYGVGLVGGTTPLRATPTGSKWGAGTSTPVCPRCQKNVYFAEQVKAVGRTWHKACLRCAECGTSLDATRLTEKEGVPHCHRCYNKLHGPAGHGYALLGKAGG